MTSMTSGSDTIRLRSRLSAADLGYPASEPNRRPRSNDLLVIDDIEIIAAPGRAKDRERPREPGRAEAPIAIVGQTRRARVAVRVFDLTVAIVGLIVLAPLMVLVAIAVMVDSRGPVVYGSPRVGHNRPTFRAWKFRSMHLDADTDLDHILARDREARREYETFHKLHNDPRLTRVGAVIRQTSLDELPQLVNILLGQMSVVGPRPKLAKDAEAYGAALDAVLVVKPGLTGLWQVSGRNLLPMSQRVLLDLEYIQTRTLFGDIMICVRTFVQLWRPGKHGAY